MTKAVYEGKYEIDSLSAFLKLSYWYWRYSTRSDMFNQEWFDGVSARRFIHTCGDSPVVILQINKAVSTIQIMQENDGQSEYTPYLFQRTTTVVSADPVYIPIFHLVMTLFDTVDRYADDEWSRPPGSQERIESLPFPPLG
jgi:meiotically up-regulated gene 157 (Mug157) protein